jgi:hypothetical protein
MLGLAPWSFSDGRLDELDGHGCGPVSSRELLAVPLNVSGGWNDDSAGPKLRVLWLSNLEMHGRATLEREEHMSTGAKSIDGGNGEGTR